MRNILFALVIALLPALGACDPLSLSDDLAFGKSVVASIKKGAPVAATALKRARDGACSALADYGQKAIFAGTILPGDGPRTQGVRASIADALGAGSDLCAISNTKITAQTVLQAMAMVSKIELLFVDLEAAAGK